MNVTCNLQALLDERKLTQVWLVKASCTNKVSISKIVRGKALPVLHNAKAIADAIGRDIKDIWPNYEQDLSAIKARRLAGLLNYYKGRIKRTEKDWPSRTYDYKKRKRIESEIRKGSVEKTVHPTDPNAVPLADGAYAGPFRLQPVAAGDDLLQDKAWCRSQAKRLHEYLLRNCAYGVYQELRSFLGNESKLIESRVDRGYEVSQ